MTQESVSMKMETEKLREEVKEESRKKQVAESSYKMLCEEKGILRLAGTAFIWEYSPVQINKKN